MKTQLTPQQAQLRLESLCARGEQCEADLREKLRRWGICSNEVEKIIANLRKDNYFDPERYCRAYTREKLRFNRWGRVKIRLMLAQKRIPAEIIDTALEEEITPQAYTRTLLELLRGKARALTTAQQKQPLAALAAFAASRGFETDLAFTAARQALNNDADESETMDT